ncbi:uncharacterized protein [Zea mays]|uniref:uncharacterized protein isoform X1 n=1 Tax=Zea mays TaxID=4577 RepID=UPI0009AA896C|nr:uncharacterized protein LOC103640373 isoform X1 [Zea mays]|eukprot:XP_020402096.1 uncharacterized protein LOC103640373 isoform X1 [Zea mays]
MPPPPHDIAHPLFSLPSLSAVDVRSPGAIACARLPPSLAPRWTSQLVWGHGSPTDRGSRRLMRNVLRRLGAFMLVNLPKKKGVLRLQMLLVCLQLSVIVNLFLLFSINLCLW